MTVGITLATFHAVNHYQPETIPQVRIDQTEEELRGTLANQLRPTFERSYRFASRETSLESLAQMVGDAQSQRVIDYQTLITDATRYVYAHTGE